MKKWIDASIISESESLDERLWEYESLMKEKPNWNNNKSSKKNKNKKKRIK